MPTELHAFAVPVSGVLTHTGAVGLFADHTWVANVAWDEHTAPPDPREGEMWLCYGRHLAPTNFPNTPRKVVQATAAHLPCALCIAPSYDGGRNLAGIAYGRQGLCHQMSNRILLATYLYNRRTPRRVSGARMYRLSVLLYGTWGRGYDQWAKALPQTCQCCFSGSTMPPANDSGSNSSFSQSTPLADTESMPNPLLELDNDAEVKKYVEEIAPRNDGARSGVWSAIRNARGQLDGINDDFSATDIARFVNRTASGMLLEMSRAVGVERLRTWLGVDRPGDVALLPEDEDGAP